MGELVFINIRIPGNWNNKIFTANWVAANLFNLPPGRSIEALITPEMNIGYKEQGVIIFPYDHLIEIQIEKLKEEKSFGVAINILNKLYDLLPHTPIKGVGINFTYIIENELIFINKYLEFIESIPGDFVNRQIIVGKDTSDRKLNVLIDFIDNKNRVQFNFHYDNFKKHPQNIISEFSKEINRIIQSWIQ